MTHLTIIDHRSDDPERAERLHRLSREGQERYEGSIKASGFSFQLSWTCPDCDADHRYDGGLHRMWHVHYRMEELENEDGSTYVRGGADATYLPVKCPQTGNEHLLCLDSSIGG